jgi:hypothetical protein
MVIFVPKTAHPDIMRHNYAFFNLCRIMPRVCHDEHSQILEQNMMIFQCRDVI